MDRRQYEMLDKNDKRYVCQHCYKQHVVPSLNEMHEEKCEMNETGQSNTGIKRK